MDKQVVEARPADSGRCIHITGIVQGVGFRPFVYGLASDLNLTGWVRNTSAGVDIEVNGPTAQIEQFLRLLQTEIPPLAHIDTVEVKERPFRHTPSFKIVHSTTIENAFQPLSPDITVCDDCLKELFDPSDPRYLYPFINCTNCGPRFTIIKDVPYDRPQTTMSPFKMCPSCAAAYHDPLDRRFHAQPVACPACGPHVWLESSVPLPSVPSQRLPFEDAQFLLTAGHILAIKGIGGFHLACDALNETAVSTLRERKLRREKPFAVMMADLDTVNEHCIVNEAEAKLLTSRERPIVILQRRATSTIAKSCAPGQQTLGVMLPYTPLHYLLFSRQDKNPAVHALVMTSGNLSEEPIAYTNNDARERLSKLADAFLLHNRTIYVRCDDSVMRIMPGPHSYYHLPLRRSRGYAPFPVKLPWEVPPILGVGGELKNVFCVANGRYAFLSHHIGDMENYETLQSFEEGITHFEKLFRVQPALIAYDKHPNYLATRYAAERARSENIPTLGIQHHHAHIAACMAEHGLTGEEPVIGLSFDGTGYGDDGTIWGGEVLVADYSGYERPFHLLPVMQPGGDRAVREPWRMALSWLHKAGIPWEYDLPPIFQFFPNGQGPTQQRATHDQSLLSASRLTILQNQLTTATNAPLTSSMGRLFDAAAALMGVRQTVNYEAQAAIEMEAWVDLEETAVYPMTLINGLIDPTPMLHQIVKDLRSGVSKGKMAAKFHNGLVETAVNICKTVRNHFHINTVVLSGGVWQNTTLLTKTIPALQKNQFQVLFHQLVPPNDGGIGLGQVIIAAQHLKKLNRPKSPNRQIVD